MKGKWIAGVLLLTLLLPYSAAAMNIRSTDIDYVWDHEGTRLYIPKTYQVETVIDDVAGGFNNPQDIFIDAQGRIFVADTGNNRIVQMSPEHEVVAVFTGDGEKEFSEPAGVFVTEEGEIYVADNRPVLIIQNDVGNRYSPTVIVAAVTSKVGVKPKLPTAVATAISNRRLYKNNRRSVARRRAAMV